MLGFVGVVSKRFCLEGSMGYLYTAKMTARLLSQNNVNEVCKQSLQSRTSVKHLISAQVQKGHAIDCVIYLYVVIIGQVPVGRHEEENGGRWSDDLVQFVLHHDETKLRCLRVDVLEKVFPFWVACALFSRRFKLRLFSGFRLTTGFCILFAMSFVRTRLLSSS